MPLIASSDAEVFEAHGARFNSYVRPARGSDQLCAWRVEVPSSFSISILSKAAQTAQFT